jgi:hypothetical protein
MHLARGVAGVSRTTMYYWIQRDWVHYRELASGRRVVCQESLSRRTPKSESDHVPPNGIRPKVPHAVQSGKLTSQ